MNISDNTDNIDRSVCPICKQKVISIANIPACSQCRRLLYHSNTAEIQDRFYEASGNMKNLADNNSKYLHELGQKELDSTLLPSEQHIYDAWVAYKNANLNAQHHMDSNCSHDEIAQSLFDFFEAVENVKKCMNV